MSAAIGSFHHVGIVVQRLAEAEEFVTSALGLPAVKRLDAGKIGLQMVFFDCGPALVELIEFANPELAKQRIGDRAAVIDHVAFAVADLDHAKDVLAGKGVLTAQAEPLVTPLGRSHFTQPETSAGVVWQLLELADGAFPPPGDAPSSDG